MPLFNNLKVPFRRRKADSDLSDELRFHLEKEVELNVTRGMSLEEARRQAMIAFGGVQQTRESVRRVRWTHPLDILVQDLRYAWRMMRKNPAFTGIAVLTLALGIGMNTAIFSLINELLFRALPANQPEDLVVLRWHTRTPPLVGYEAYGDCVEEVAGGSGCSFSLPFFENVREQTQVFAGVAAFAGPPYRLVLSTGGPASAVDNAQLVSGEYFPTLGVGAALGRTLGPADDVPSATPALLLSYRYWQTAFGGQPSVVGSTVRLNGMPFTVVGVADKRFAGLAPGHRIDLWLPLSVRPQLLPERFKSVEQEGPKIWWLDIVGRPKPGVSVTQASAAITLLYRDATLHGEKPVFKSADEPGVDLVPAHQALNGFTADTLPPLYILMMAAGLVLLIASATIAGLLLARAAAREKEIAIRLALGARRGRLITQLLSESLLLSILGGLSGLAVAYWGARLLLQLLSDSSQGGPQFAPRTDLRVLAFAAAVSVVTGVLFGLAPALRSRRADFTPALKASSGGTQGSASRRGWLNLGHGLVVIQVSLAVVGLVCAGMLVHTLANLRGVDLGFASDNVLVFSIDAGAAGYQDARAGELYGNLRERFAALPGVTSAGYSWASLLSGSLWRGRVHVPGKPENVSEAVDNFMLGPGFFATMKIPRLAGRDLTEADLMIAQENAAAQRAWSANPSPTKEAPHEVPLPAIVNEAFVRHFFPHGDALGQRVESPLPIDARFPRGAGWRIVGVVRDAKYNDLRRDINPTMYLPFSNVSAVFELRTAGAPNRLVPAVREIANRTDRNLAVLDIDTESAQIDGRLFVERRIAQLSSFFGLLALALAAAGVYGLLAYEVARRTREIGIRMAIGAQRGDVVSLVLRQGLLVAMAGAVIGAGASFAAKRLLSAILYNVKPGDPLTLVSVTTLLVVVALAACYLPARRATRVDPLVALREE
jgi:predicted permease